MAVDLENIEKVSSIRYGLITDDMTRSKDKDKAQAKDQVKMIPDYGILSRT